MIELSEKEIKNKELETLLFIDNVCKDNNIRFYLAYGTALGAIRHKGFIPWDDDIDICMFRDDYNRFCNAFDSERYKLLNESVNEYTLPLQKVIDTSAVLIENNKIEAMKLGPYVDIFVLDKVPKSKIQRKIFYVELFFYQKLWTIFQYDRYVKNTNLIYKLYNICFNNLKRIFNPKKISSILYKKANKYNRIDSEFVSTLSFSSNRERDTFKKSVFSDGYVVEFENHNFVVPKEWDFYLSKRYGRYMELPPMESRVTNHSFKAYKE